MLLDFDYSILNFIHDHFVCTFGDIFFPMFTSLGNKGFLWIAIALFLFFIKKDKKSGITVIISLIFSLIICNIMLKNLVARPRPFEGMDISLLIPVPLDYSFPSGHTMSSFAASFVLYNRNKKSGVIAFLVAFLIGFSRLYLYVHFPSDVLCGAILGIFAGYLAIKVSNKFVANKFTVHKI